MALLVVILVPSSPCGLFKGGMGLGLTIGLWGGGASVVQEKALLVLLLLANEGGPRRGSGLFQPAQSCGKRRLSPVDPSSEQARAGE